MKDVASSNMGATLQWPLKARDFLNGRFESSPDDSAIEFFSFQGGDCVFR